MFREEKQNIYKKQHRINLIETFQVCLITKLPTQFQL